jgi:hypothetical protein
METKKNFPKKIGETKPSVSFEEPQITVSDTTPGDLLEHTPITPSLHHLAATNITETPVQQVQEEMIPKSQIDSYVEGLINKRLLEFPIINTPRQAQEVAPRKVESSDDLPEFDKWEVKDRIYVLCTGYSSLSQGIKDRHKRNSPLMYKGRSLRYSTSQASFFMDKQVGDVLLSYLSIEEGRLFVSKENTHLQKFLAIHPDNGVVFKEFNPKEESKSAYDAQRLKVKAHILETTLDDATITSIAMLMCNGYNETLDIITIKRDLYNEIEINPSLFIKLASDVNLKLKSIGKLAVNRGILKFSNYRFLDENDAIICESNRNENEYETLASYFATSEGRVLYEYLLHKIENK